MALLYVPEKNGIQKSLAAQLDQGDTSVITLNNTTDVPNKRGVVTLNRIDPDGNVQPSSEREYIIYSGVSGSTLTIESRGAGGSVDQDHGVGTVVEFVPDVEWANALTGTIEAEHNADGTHSDITADSVTAPLADFTNSIKFNAPEGFLINGKIVPTVTSNNLTLALKTLNDEDPSATNPVYIRLAGVIRSITSALSVTRDGGSFSWSGAASTEMAGKEIDWFVYIGWKAATPAPIIGFSRMCHFRRGGDSGASGVTDPRYVNWSSDPASTDAIDVVGRFAATMTSGPNAWSVPTFTATNLIQRPIFETRLLAWQPTYSASSPMTWTSVTTDRALYKIRGSSLHLDTAAVGTTGGTASNTLFVTTPFNILSPTNMGIGCRVVEGSSISGFVYGNSTTELGFRRYDGANFGLGVSRGHRGYLYLDLA
jgi:hypothetical protein